MTKKQNRLLYLQNIYTEAGKTIMQKLFDEYLKYINFAHMAKFSVSDNSCVFICDPVSAFFDTLCQQLEKDKFCNETIYYIMSPFHKKDVVCGMLVATKNIFIKNSQNFSLCKAVNLYSIAFDQKTIKYLQISSNLFKKSN